MLLGLFMVCECEIAHFGYNGATVCILIHRHHSAPMRKSSPFTPCTYDQNHKSPSTSLTSLLQLQYLVETLSASFEPA